MTVSILGCGWFGKAVALSLIKAGITVKGSSTSADGLRNLSALGIDPYLVAVDGDHELTGSTFFLCDALIVSIPPKLKAGEGQAYLSKLQKVIGIIKKSGINNVIYISSTGVYGENNSDVDEHTAPEPDTDNGRILLAAEKLFHAEKSFRTTVIRFGGLVGPGRDPGRFFAGKKDIPNGKAPVNLIHLDDCIGITKLLIEQQIFGLVINACSPHHPSKADFYTLATQRAGLAVPEFKNELLRWKRVNSSYLTKQLSYKFVFDDWGRVLFE